MVPGQLKNQLSLQDAGAEVEYLAGARGPAIPILLTPITGGIDVTCPESVELIGVESLDDGVVRISVRMRSSNRR